MSAAQPPGSGMGKYDDLEHDALMRLLKRCGAERQLDSDGPRELERLRWARRGES